MGYDMRIKGDLPEPDADQLAKLDKANKEAGSEASRVRASLVESGTKNWWDTPEYLKASDAYENTFSAYMAVKDPGYFRLNGHGMWRYLEVMLALGMAHDHASPEIDWASLPDYDDGEDAYYEASDKLTGIHPGDDPTIPTFKFSSNDGWYVSPDECRASVSAWDARQTEGLPADLADDLRSITDTSYWGKWINYLRLAADNQGFRVH
ncbi:hypothetical protein SEA_ABBYDAISY_75 [Arthrobacter phage AbbyDaisy]|nr:hypothetical protein SEA_ABBYDAISY_75 [Arthrobacter phage AbbyDaisy]